MVGDFKACGGKVFEPAGDALLKVENLTAVAAMKVVMMTLVGSFVAGRLTWDFDTADKTIFLKVFQGPVDGCDSERGNGFEGQTMDIIRKQGPLLFLQNSLDCFFLACGAALDAQGVTMVSAEPYFKPSTMVRTLCLIMES